MLETSLENMLAARPFRAQGVLCKYRRNGASGFVTIYEGYNLDKPMAGFALPPGVFSTDMRACAAIFRSVKDVVNAKRYTPKATPDRSGIRRELMGTVPPVLEQGKLPLLEAPTPVKANYCAAYTVDAAADDSDLYG